MPGNLSRRMNYEDFLGLLLVRCFVSRYSEIPSSNSALETRTRGVFTLKTWARPRVALAMAAALVLEFLRLIAQSLTGELRHFQIYIAIKFDDQWPVRNHLAIVGIRCLIVQIDLQVVF